jgi:hypothetical protein
MRPGSSASKLFRDGSSSTRTPPPRRSTWIGERRPVKTPWRSAVGYRPPFATRARTSKTPPPTVSHAEGVDGHAREARKELDEEARVPVGGAGDLLGGGLPRANGRKPPISTAPSCGCRNGCHGVKFLSSGFGSSRKNGAAEKDASPSSK